MMKRVQYSPSTVLSLKMGFVSPRNTDRFAGSFHISDDIKKHGKTPEEGEAAYQWWDKMLTPYKDLIASLPETFSVKVDVVQPDPKQYSYSCPKWLEVMRIFFPTANGEPVDYRRVSLSVYEDQKTGQLKRYEDSWRPDDFKNLFAAIQKEIKRLGIVAFADAQLPDRSMPTTKAYVSESVINQRMIGLMYHPDNYHEAENHYNRVCQALEAHQEITDRFPEGALFRIRTESAQFADWDKMELVLSDPLVREETVIPMGQYCVYQDVGDRYSEVENQNPAIEQSVQQAVEKAKCFVETHFPGRLLPPFKEC
jgi:hypothetical protein